MASLYFLYQKYKARKAAPEAEPPAPSLEKDLESAKPSLDAPAGVRVTTDVERSPPTGVKRWGRHVWPSRAAPGRDPAQT